MNLVFDNCVRYNGPENMIAKHSIEIKAIFEENMKQMGYIKWQMIDAFFEFSWLTTCGWNFISLDMPLYNHIKCRL
jgi:hypothetical protein